MAQNFRHSEILQMARRDGMVTVEGLATHFGVTLQTIRKDLSELAEDGRLERVHGGAVLPSGTENIEYGERQALNRAAKSAMAQACAAAIPNGSSIFLNIGTSTEAVAHELMQHQDILVVTNNMNVANILAGNLDADIVLAGGALRRSDGGLIGPITINTIRRFKFDFAVIGCSALDLDGDILDFDIEEVDVSRAIIEQARTVFLVADHSKFSRAAPARIGSMAEIDGVFTDQPLPPALAKKCRTWNTDVTVA